MPIYPAQPILKDTINRGNYSATRTDSTTYVLEKEGEVELPEVVISWWNLESEELEEAKLPAVSFNVAPNPEYKTTTNPISNNGDPVVTLKRALLDALTWLRNNIVKITISAIVVYLFYLACHQYGPPLIRKTQGYLKLARESEFVAYLKLCKNLWMKNKDKTVPSFWKWLDCVTPGNQSASLELLARKVNDLEFNALAKNLTANRYNVDKTARPIRADFYRKMARFRKKLVVRDIVTGTGSEKKLNPQR